jgi:hypothetical protein
LTRTIWGRPKRKQQAPQQRRGARYPLRRRSRSRLGLANFGREERWVCGIARVLQIEDAKSHGLSHS